jgi:thioredoxin reductase
VDTGHRQATGFGAELIKASVTDVRRTEEGFRLATEQGDFDARQVILATGATADLAAKIGLATRPATEPHIKTVLVVDPAGRTSKRGIWAAGTVAGTSVHVAVTSGDGARVVINLISEGNGARWVDHDVLKVNREDEQHHETGRTPQSTADIVAK